MRGNGRGSPDEPVTTVLGIAVKMVAPARPLTANAARSSARKPWQSRLRPFRAALEVDGAALAAAATAYYVGGPIRIHVFPLKLWIMMTSPLAPRPTRNASSVFSIPGCASSGAPFRCA